MTIVDIAKESGYSISTVSRVLNNRQDVSPEAKKKINEIVKKRGFIPNDNAKHLKQSVTKNILVIVKGTSNMMFASIIEQIQELMDNAQYTVGVTYLEEGANEVSEAVRLCRERKPLGVLFLGANPQYFTEEFNNIDVPCVVIATGFEDTSFENLSSVATDDKKASEKAVDFLFDKGHENIAVLGGNLSISHTSVLRFKGCEKSFENHNRKFDFLYYENALFSFESAYSAMGRLLDRNIPISAVFAMSDTMAIGAIRAIRDRGLSVPEDISIIGFDGTTLADYYNPKIATIRQDFKKMARRGVEILLNMINLNQKSVNELISFTLSEGESVAKTS